MYKTRFTVTAAALAIAQAFPALAQQNEPAMTEVVVAAVRGSADTASVAGFAETPLLQTPASVNVLTRERMQDLNIRSTTDAARYDASISDAYNAVGYAEQFSIRGFKLNNASSYRKDGLAISGDTQIPLENKESIEVLKGLAGLQYGIAAPGGIVNYVTKRPTEQALRSVLFEVSERGTVLGAVDVGGRFEDRRFGYRINVAGERLRSYIEGADGHRGFVSAAFDWRISPQALLQVDADYQKKSQVSAPGFQLIDGVRLPTGVAADTMLNNQPWSEPVETESANFGARFQYQFTPEWKAVVSANQHVFKRDDYTAFPYGCGAIQPGFCANGDYDMYDYRSLGEKKKPFSAQALLQGRFATGTLAHEFTAGLSWFRNKESWGDYVYDPVGTSNVWHPVPLQMSTNQPGPVSERRNDLQRGVFVQDIVGLADGLKLHAGARFVNVQRNEIDVAPTDENFWLPNVAVVYNPQANVTLYASYSQGLDHGGIAPLGTGNANRALAPGKSKQVELGAKADVHGIQYAAALFQIEKGLEYTDDALKLFVRNGQARHRGLEFSAQGKVLPDLTVGASLAALHTEQSGTGKSNLDGKRVTDVPALRSTVFAEYAFTPALKVNGDWQFAGKKAFDDENTVFVPKYHVFNLGASYATRMSGMPLVLRAQVRNVADKFYWRDVTPELGLPVPGRGTHVPGVRAAELLTGRMGRCRRPSTSEAQHLFHLAQPLRHRALDAHVRDAARGQFLGKDRVDGHALVFRLAAQAIGRPREVRRAQERHVVAARRHQLRQPVLDAAEVVAAVDGRHQRRRVAEQEAAGPRGRQVFARGLRFGDVQLVALDRHAAARLDELAQVLRHPHVAIALGERLRQRRLARRRAADDGDARQAAAGQRHFSTIAALAALASSSPAIDLRHASRPMIAITTNIAYSTAVSIRPLCTYSATYSTSTMIHVCQFSSFLRDNSTWPTRLPAVRKPSANGTSVSVFDFRNHASPANSTSQATAATALPRHASAVTGRRSWLSSPRSHWYQPHTETAMNTSCRPMSPYSFDS